MSNSYIIPMLDKAFAVLEYFSSHPGEVRLSELAQALDLPKTTAFRILSTMQKWNYVERDDEQETYRLGKTLIKVGQRAAADIDITGLAKPFLNQLAKETGESANLGILHENVVLTIANVPGEDFYLISRLIPMSPLNCSAMGKQFLYDFTPEQLADYFSGSLPKQRTVNSIVKQADYAAIRRAMANERISFDREEYEYGLSCIAAPILDGNQRAVAAISISGPTTRLQHKGEDKLIRQLKQTAEQITQAYREVFK